MRETVFNKEIINGKEFIVMRAKWNTSYEQGIKDFVDYLNSNAFELRHNMELIQKYAEKFIGDK